MMLPAFALSKLIKIVNQDVLLNKCRTTYYASRVTHPLRSPTVSNKPNQLYFRSPSLMVADHMVLNLHIVLAPLVYLWRVDM